MPDDEPFDYLPTQAIVDFLSALPEPTIDGLIYPSVQSGEKGKNVVLFHKASRVQEVPVTPGTKIEAHLGWDTEDGFGPQLFSVA